MHGASYYLLRMLVYLSLWARSRHEARQLYFEKFYFGSTGFYLLGGHDTTFQLSCFIRCVPNWALHSDLWVVCCVRFWCGMFACVWSLVVHITININAVYCRQLLIILARGLGAPTRSLYTSIRQLNVLQHSFGASDAYQHPGKWYEVLNPMCTPSNRLCETTATCWCLTNHGKASAIYLSIISGLQRARRDYLLTRHHLPLTCESTKPYTRESSWSL